MINEKVLQTLHERQHSLSNLRVDSPSGLKSLLLGHEDGMQAGPGKFRNVTTLQLYLTGKWLGEGCARMIANLPALTGLELDVDSPDRCEHAFIPGKQPCDCASASTRIMENLFTYSTAEVPTADPSTIAITHDKRGPPILKLKSLSIYGFELEPEASMMLLAGIHLPALKNLSLQRCCYYDAFLSRLTAMYNSQPQKMEGLKSLCIVNREGLEIDFLKMLDDCLASFTGLENLVVHTTYLPDPFFFMSESEHRLEHLPKHAATLKRLYLSVAKAYSKKIRPMPIELLDDLTKCTQLEQVALGLPKSPVSDRFELEDYAIVSKPAT